MEIEKKLFALAGIITVVLFILIYSLNIFIASGRERVLTEKMDTTINQYEEMQTLSLMATSFGNDSTCIALQGSLAEMDKTLWDLGTKIDSYRKLTEEYMSDPFYIDQKTKFNRREVLYYLLLKDTRKRCGLASPTVLFFYQKKEECPDCDALSFVLTDIKLDSKDLSVFSFDSDLNSSSIKTLERYYNITSYPCLVIEEHTYCSFFNKDELVRTICGEKNFSQCRVT
jgi:hypothetical protein